MNASNTYDETPYPFLSYSETHPDLLSAIATVLGMNPKPINQCRVLDIGGASGGNLLPLALVLPQSEFVVVDYSARQIEEGQTIAAALGLTNIHFLHQDIMAMSPDLGQFDYIIAHGLYSWVPATVRDQLLAVIKQLLAPQGVAYVSYNLYPGWFYMRMMREMMLYHTRHIHEPAAKAREARAYIQFLSEGVKPDSGAFGLFLHSYQQVLNKDVRVDATLLHDELETVNEPVYFHQFAGHAAAHGLQYLAEADFDTVFPSNFPPAVTEKLLQMATDAIDLEQQMDFLRNRTFRKTLLCHEGVNLNRNLSPAQAQHLRFAARIHPLNDKPDITGNSVERFQAINEATFATNHPVTKAALVHLGHIAPQTLPFARLLHHAITMAYPSLPDQATINQDATLLAANLLKASAYSPMLMELHTWQSPFTLEIAAQPTVSPYARWQAQTQRQVTNLRHERIRLDGLTHFLVIQLDGTVDRAALRERIAAAMQNGSLPKPENVDLEQEITLGLKWLAQAALLWPTTG
ncbi:MAG: class I SAM-dependent methyltransferase [Chloroflexi bacterium]|nr:class I SAM-dependent methyltransferase [Chloroflexota bacterium]